MVLRKKRDQRSTDGELESCSVCDEGKIDCSWSSTSESKERDVVFCDGRLSQDYRLRGQRIGEEASSMDDSAENPWVVCAGVP